MVKIISTKISNKNIGKTLAKRNTMWYTISENKKRRFFYMSKTANVFTRVDPVVKEQAETVLSQLGISMSTAMGMFLQQLVLQRGIPFDVKLPQTKPVALGSLTDDEFNALMDGAVRSAAAGKCVPFEEFDTNIRQELGI